MYKDLFHIKKDLNNAFFIVSKKLYLCIKVNKNSAFLVSKENDIIVISFSKDIKKTEYGFLVNNTMKLEKINSIQISGLSSFKKQMNNPNIKEIENDYINKFISGWKLIILMDFYKIKIHNKTKLWIKESIIKANEKMYICNKDIPNKIHTYKETLNKKIEGD